MTRGLGWGCSSVVRHLPGICNALGSIPSTRKEKKKPRYCNMPVFLPSLSHFLLFFLLGASQAVGKCYTIEYSLSKGRKSI